MYRRSKKYQQQVARGLASAAARAPEQYCPIFRD